MKIGRNAPCPCGSGRKFKHCHGSLRADTPEFPRNFFAALQAREHRRVQQQGLGRPIVSFQGTHGHRFVAVGNTIHYSKNWRSFHDFLFSYIKEVFGGQWGADEQKKELSLRHPVMQLNHYVGVEHKKALETKAPGSVASSIATGAVRAYLDLSYYLYLIAHNSRLHELLIKRLKAGNHSSFYGAYYETFVAACFIKANFELEFEDETDSEKSHCEFTAISPSTKRRYSVEAKSRFRPFLPPTTAVEGKFRILPRLKAALEKEAPHDRIVFIDLNHPDTTIADDRPWWGDGVLGELRSAEENMRLATGELAPPAYIFVTNNPNLHYLEKPAVGLSLLAEGFKIPGFKSEQEFRDLRAALDARERHSDAHGMLKAISKFAAIPSTFDGNLPEMEFNKEGRQVVALQVGEYYEIPDPSGKSVVAELVQGIVVESEGKAYLLFRNPDGRIHVYKDTLSASELKAYEASPETFFGVVQQEFPEPRNALDFFDFFYTTYSKSSKETLLKLMKDAPDASPERLSELSQEELAKIYCERCAYAAMAIKK